MPEPFLPFQSTLPRRKRRYWFHGGLTACCISIHASAKEATQLTVTSLLRIQFQSTLPRRKRHASRIWMISDRLKFQSTLPRRKRRKRHRVGLNRSHFNPRFREGSDSVFIDPPTIDRHFNPRFREGSDKIHPRRACGTDMISIHASAKEATVIL